jgi:hypothetical protein
MPSSSQPLRDYLAGEIALVAEACCRSFTPAHYVPRAPEVPRIAATGGEENGAEGEVVVLANVPGPAMRNWRYVVGTFQVKIPVTTSEVMLRPEENTLAIIKWRLTQLKPGNRWRPVLERYISYIAARVDGLGGDSMAILGGKEIPLPLSPERKGSRYPRHLLCGGDDE